MSVTIEDWALFNHRNYRLAPFFASITLSATFEPKPILDKKQIQAAAARIQSTIHQTPILTSQYFNRLTGRQLYFKAEHLQKTGSFKARGALNATLQLKPGQILVSRILILCNEQILKLHNTLKFT